MSSLKYVGRQATSDTGVVSRSYVDSSKASAGVAQADVDSSMSSALASKSLKTYVDSQDALKADKTYVNTQDGNYLPTSSLSAVSGVAALNSSGALDTTRFAKTVGSVAAYTYTGMSYTGWVGANTVNLGSFSFSNPGYLWRPVVVGGGFRMYQGSTTNGRCDIQVSLDSYTGTVIGYATSAMSDTNVTPISLSTEYNNTTFSGGKNVYIKTFRGYGSENYYLYCDSTCWLTLILLPVAS